MLISNALFLSKVSYLVYKLHNHHRVLIGTNNKVAVISEWSFMQSSVRNYPMLSGEGNGNPLQ